MRNLLDMERDFFSGTNRVNFNRINGLLTSLSDSKKAKFDTTLKLSKATILYSVKPSRRFFVMMKVNSMLVHSDTSNYIKD